MIDHQFDIHRYVAEYSEETEKLVARYDLSSFDFSAFKEVFEEYDPESTMLDCYPIYEGHTEFLRAYLKVEPEWDFEQKSYFVEADGVQGQAVRSGPPALHGTPNAMHILFGSLRSLFSTIRAQHCPPPTAGVGSSSASS